MEPTSFELLRSQFISSLQVTVEEYRHNATGALHYHMSSDNNENVFLVGLRTVPTDSTGVAHILEHTALCGSEKYQVRDPFFMMIRRSLNTFMNAFTSSDWTAYPFASQNKKDFNNLLDVYLDAVFFSRIAEIDFSQEGHRFEFATHDDINTDLTYKGVVYNEMKGAMSSPVSILWQSLSGHLYPDNTYHFNSGGEPENIPDLSYQQLKEFYQKHYHPSNAIFMTYGDIPAAEHQAKFESQVLSRFEARHDNIHVKLQESFTTPKIIEESYPLTAAEAKGDKTHIVISWMLGESIDFESLLRAHFLSAVLMDNSASPLMHVLETTDLGAAPSPLCGLEDSNRQMCLACGLEGSKPENADKLEALVLQTLQQVAEEGVPQAQLEAVLHQLELGQREITGASYPYGLQLILKALPATIHRGDPLKLLDLEPALEALRNDIQDPNFIKQLVTDLLLNNNHRIRLTLKPDTGMQARHEQALAEKLASIKVGLSDEEKQAIVNNAEALLARQSQKDDPDILPKVTLSDIPAELSIAKGHTQRGKFDVTRYAQGTNGLVYQDVIFQLPELPAELLPYLPIYNALITELGCGADDYLAMQSEFYAKTGGISASTSMRANADNEQNITAKWILSSKALHRNNESMTALLHRVFKQVRFDEHDRICEVIAQMRASVDQQITSNGHHLAMLTAAQKLSPILNINHQCSGMAGIQFIRQLDNTLQDKTTIKQLTEKLHAIHGLMQQASREFLIIGEEESLAGYAQTLQQTWQQVTTNDNTRFSLPNTRELIRQAWVTSTQVSFCGMAFPAVPYAHKDAAVYAVLAPFLRNGYLHRAIREQGGAYGGGASFDSDNAVFKFYSYRDPRITGTLNDFRASMEWMLSQEHDVNQLEEAILTVIAGIDKPSSPAGEARKAFYSEKFGRIPAIRNQVRQNVLNVTIEDLQRVTSENLLKAEASAGVITSEDRRHELANDVAEICEL